MLTLKELLDNIDFQCAIQTIKDYLKPKEVYLVGGFAKKGYSRKDIDILIIFSEETLKKTVWEFQIKMCSYKTWI